MAKNNATAITKMSKKAKILNFLRLFGLSFAGVTVMVMGVVLYVWITGGFNPPYEPLTSWYWASEILEDGTSQEKNEFVIDGNKEIELDTQGNQKRDSDGNLVWKQKVDENGNPVYEKIYLIPNEGCTELDAILKIETFSNASVPLQLVEDDNVKGIVKQDEQSSENENTENQQDRLYFEYNVKINSPIFLRPLTKMVTINGRQTEVNVGGWVKLTATQGLITTYCWVFVDTAIENLEINLNQDIDLEENGTEQVYNVYPNSVLSLSSIVLPNSSTLSPSTSFPTGKTSTIYNNSKSVYYRTSNNEIATIDENGNITIMPNKEGEIFSIDAYIVAKYNNVGNEPSLQDYEGDPSQDATIPYTRAFDKIRVWSNKLTFKINEISVVQLTTGSKNIVVEPYNVFETGNIYFSNTETNPRKNNYYIDLILSNTADESYKNVLLGKVELFVGVEVDGEAETPESVNSLDDIRINDKRIVDASKYFELIYENGVYSYNVNEYSANNFYFIFYYEMEDDPKTIYYDYMPFKLQKRAVTSVITNVSVISLEYDNHQNSETFSLDGFATVNPNNSTYKEVLYFVPKTDSLSNMVVKTNENIKAIIANKECYAVAVEKDGNYDYLTLAPLKNGKTYLYAAVVRTTERFDGLNYENLITNDGYVEIEYVSDFVNVTITKNVTISDIVARYNNQEIQFDKESLNSSDPDYSFASDCDVFAKIYKGEEIDFEIIYLGTTDALENDKLKIQLLEGASENITSITNKDNTIDGQYKFKIVSQNVGSVKYQVIYDNQLQYTIGVIVLTTELSGLHMQTQKDESKANLDINLNFVTRKGTEEQPVSYEEAHTPTGYYWSSIALKMGYESPKTNDQEFEIYTYAYVDAYADILDKYIGKDYDEVVDGVDESINTIQKLISKLEVDESVIKVYPYDTNGISQEIMITRGDNSQVKFKYDVINPGQAFVVAKSITTDIYSNPILINISCPEIKIVREKDSQELDSLGLQEVLAYGEMTTIDGHISQANQINLFGDGDNFVKFVVDVGDEQYDLRNLVFFKFENQTATTQEYTSNLSGAKISLLGTHAVLNLVSIANDVSENIIAFTKFGYVNAEYCQLDLKVNCKYKVTDSTKVYLTPNKINLFKGENKDIYPDMMFINLDYDFDNIAPQLGNRLYLPEGFVTAQANENIIDKLKDILPEEFVDSFNYADDEDSDEYYHIYFAIEVNSDGNNSNNYIVDGYDINLTYKSTSQGIYIRFKFVGEHLLQTQIRVNAGLTYTGETSDTVLVNSLVAGYDLSETLNSFVGDTSNFEANIVNIDFTANSNNEDLYFYYIDSNNKYVETFVNIVPEQDVDYISEAEFNNLSDNDKAEYVYYEITDDTLVDTDKTYYEYNGNTYSVVNNPSNENIGNYYEIRYCYYYIKTSDVSAIDVSKQYYVKSGDTFEPVEYPDINDVDNYYEIVYSNNEFYSNETYYEEIPKENLSVNYIGNYYVYRENVGYEPASLNTFDKDNVKYYYKKNYKKVEFGGDITEVCKSIKINLENNGTGFRVVTLQYDADIMQYLEDNIDLYFTVGIKIVNKSQENISSNHNMVFALSIV